MNTTGNKILERENDNQVKNVKMPKERVKEREKYKSRKIVENVNTDVQQNLTLKNKRVFFRNFGYSQIMKIQMFKIFSFY